LKIHRLDLDGLGSPAAIAAKIHELVPDMPDKVPVEELCPLLDICSIEEVEAAGFEAALVMDELKASGGILLRKGAPLRRRRFSIGHELGHFLIPSHRPRADQNFECSMADLHRMDARDRDLRRRREAEANRFAARLLMPPERLKARLRKGPVTVDDLVAMARDFGVSKEAMGRSWIDTHPEPIAVIVVHKGRVLRQYRGEDFPWLQTTNGVSLPFGSLAATYAAEPGTASEVEEIDADVWLGERDAERVLALTEQVLAQRDGYAMMLLQAELDDE
jgi:Zn-dependent peptidase ImmA (M78 family)